MPPKRTATARHERSTEASVRAHKRIRIEPEDPPPDPVPDGLREARAEITRYIEAMERVPLRRRLDVHWKIGGVPRGDPENIIRELNVDHIKEVMERDAQVSAAFASLKKTLEEGKPAPGIYNPYVKHGKWSLFSSEVFTEFLLWNIDNMEFKQFCVNQWIEFHDPDAEVDFMDCHCGRPETYGTIVGPRQIKGDFKPFDWPQEASLEPIVVKTSSRCREIKMWFAGNGYMRMQCDMGSVEELANGQAKRVTWNAIQNTKEHKEREQKAFMARRRREDEEFRVRQAEAIRRREREEEQAREQKKEDHRLWVKKNQRRLKLRRKYEDGDINSSELELSTEEEDGEGATDAEESRSSASPEPWDSSTGEEDWTESESEEEESEEEEEEEEEDSDEEEPESSRF
ncbi:uncharacterized protein J4E84_002675 [Alternaria hordeiaustralica]|uniref:uncharacterized protein n=1 Tax=Alternaria hordeiaustralica TaxID=1187925 RepID=UPI0020C5539F|nr:uncharacterized protein J4E84_002675 [Alternaria hordeiaustralica]KAI4694095.1 hypothetical protein J4E84_002675 [Alternaria hordeiaustralica]